MRRRSLRAAAAAAAVNESAVNAPAAMHSESGSADSMCSDQTSTIDDLWRE